MHLSGDCFSIQECADYESPGSADSDNDYSVTVTISDGTNTGSTVSYTVTVADANDQTPSYSAGGLTPSLAEGTTAVDSFTVTDTDTGDSNSCTLGGDDASDFTCTVSGDSISIAFSSAPDYDSPGDTGTNNVYDFTAAISDGTNTGSTLTYQVTVTDLNDQTPTYSSSDTTPSISEGTTAVETLTVTDTDSADVNACTLGGTDFASFTCTVSGDSVALAFSSGNVPDFENPGSADSDNDYSVTVTISDGTNTGATIAYTITVIDSVDIIVLGGQSANLAESASVGDTVISLVITEATPTNVIIAAGNGDSIFAVSSAGVITVASTANWITKPRQATRSHNAYNAQSSDVADVTINIVDANDAPSAGNDATGALTEDASTSTVQVP